MFRIPPIGLVAGGLAAAGAVGLAACAGDDDASSKAESKVNYQRETEESTQALSLDGTKQVIHSVPIKDAQAGERIMVRSELAATNDVATDHAQEGGKLWKAEHRYDVGIGTEIVLTEKPGQKTGTAIGERSEQVISPQQHHAIQNADGEIIIPEELAGKDLFVNVVADAVTQDGKPPKDCYPRLSSKGAIPDGECALTLDPGDGMTHVTRIAPDAPEPERLDSGEGAEKISSIPFPKPAIPQHDPMPRHVALSVPVGDVKKGEVLDVQSQIAFKSGVDMPTLVTGELVLTNDPQGTDGKAVSDFQGQNIPPGEEATYHKNGTYKVEKSMKDAYVNLVLRTGAAGALYNPGGELPVVENSGRMTVDRYASE
jgi:hypothetical protein